MRALCLIRGRVMWRPTIRDWFGDIVGVVVDVGADIVVGNNGNNNGNNARAAPPPWLIWRHRRVKGNGFVGLLDRGWGGDKENEWKNNENKKQQWIDREEPASQVTERKEREELFYSEKKKMKKPKKAKKTKITKTTKTKTAKTKTCWLGLASQVTTKKKKLTAKVQICVGCGFSSPLQSPVKDIVRWRQIWVGCIDVA